MLLKELIITELIKLRKSYFVFFLLGFNILSVLIGSVIFSANREVFKNDGNQSLVLWGQGSLYSSQLFFPMLIGVLCAVSWQFEEKDRNWQRMSIIPVKKNMLVLAKFFSIQIFTGMNQLLFLALFNLSAFVLRVPDIQVWNFTLWCFLGWIGTFSITAIQMFFSIRLRNFSFSILLSAVGAILGLMTLFVGDFLFNIFPYSQIAVGMRARTLTNFSVQEFILFCVMSVLFSVFALSLSVKLLNNRED
ncbi:hypothetical protein CNY62_12005 [Brochothrix thermosphacta]|uniref:ABC transporter permease n=1 Tax=Brochothrix thermosphacta TaxID=2756 RepID=A0A291C0Q4_BROTH|nr:hypothetical protein CNY62_12005 [Brochothrix thermosphacta]